MVLQLTKRDGRQVPFEGKKIYDAVYKACKAVSYTNTECERIATKIQEEVEKYYIVDKQSKVIPTVEDVQERVMNELIKEGMPEVTKAYIEYRTQRTMQREMKSDLNKALQELTFASAKESNLKRDNGNVNGDTAMGMMLQFGSTTSREFTDKFLLSSETKEAVDNMDIYIHDKDFYPMGTLTCCQIPLDKLFKEGFNPGHGMIRPPQTIQSYASLTAIAIQSNQNEMHGGQAIPLFDFYLAPGVVKSFRKNFLEILNLYLDTINITQQTMFVPASVITNADEHGSRRNDMCTNADSNCDYKNTTQMAITAPAYNSYISSGSLSDVSDIDADLKQAIQHLTELPLSSWKQENATKTIQTISEMLEKAGVKTGFIPSIWAKSLQKTDRDTYQAMESLVHNFNTMHCLPYSEEIWVYDTKEKEVYLIPIGDLEKDFEKNRYEAISINPSSFKVETKPITHIQKKDNQRDLVTIVNKAGQKVTTTDNHRILTLNTTSLKIEDAFPNTIENVISPRFWTAPNTTNFIDLKRYNSKNRDIYRNTVYKKDFVKVDECFSELFGYYVADGSITSKGTSIDLCVCDKVKEERIKELVENVFGEGFAICTLKYNRNGEQKNKSIRICLGARLCRMVIDKFGRGSKNKKIPSEILFGDNFNKIAFLNGYLHCDGAHKEYYAEINCTSKLLVAQIHLMLLSLGEFPTIKEKKNPQTGYKTNSTFYSLILGGKACERIGIKLLRYPDIEYPKYNLSFLKHKVKNYSKRRKSNAVRYNELLEKTNFENIFISDVEERIELNSREEYVYDISVKDNENFLTKDCIFVHNCRAGSQVPFSSINFGMDTSEEGRMVSHNLLLAQEAGLGKGETPIFPILIFQVKEGVNYNEGDPNYDLFKLSFRVSSKRLFPNYVFVDAPFNLQYYDPEDPETIIATMGCVDGKHSITYKIGDNIYHEPFEDAWYRLTRYFVIQTAGMTDFMDCENMSIYDSNFHDFVTCHRILRNPDMGNWMKVTFETGHVLMATADHPLPLQRGRVFVQDITVRDIGYVLHDEKVVESRIVDIEFVGSRGRYSYDVTTASDRFDISNILSHNCRTRVIGNVNGKQTPVGRGNLSFTTINLPRLGIKHGTLYRQTENRVDDWDKEGFFCDLDRLLDISAQQLLERYAYQKQKRIANFPFLMGQKVWNYKGEKRPEEKLDDIIDSGTLSVGFIGLAECLKALTGQHHGESPEVQQLGLDIIRHMREKMDEMTEKTHLNFSVLATPSEGLSGKFTKADRKKYGVIEGVTDREYYTNSFHVPVYYPIDFVSKIRLESPYHALTNAGHITYVEMDGNPEENLEAFETIIRCMKESGIGYGSINHPIDRDPVCGYTGVIEGDTCPGCGRPLTNKKIKQGYLALESLAQEE